MTQVLMLYSTTDGHTLTICRRMAEILESRGQSVQLCNILEAGAVALGGFDKIVIGASIRYGKHNPLVQTFIKANLAILQAKPGALFSVNLVARKPNKNQPETNPYFRRFLKQIPWKPQLLAVFAGKLDYPRYSLWDRYIIRLIMFITGGPTDPNAVVEFTDWQQVADFAEAIVAI